MTCKPSIKRVNYNTLRSNVYLKCTTELMTFPAGAPLSMAMCYYDNVVKDMKYIPLILRSSHPVPHEWGIKGSMCYHVYVVVHCVTKCQVPLLSWTVALIQDMSSYYSNV